MAIMLQIPMLEKAMVKHHLPVHFCSNTRRWVTGLLVIDYQMSEFEGELWEYCAILLIVNNAFGNPTVIQELGEHIKYS